LTQSLKDNFFVTSVSRPTRLKTLALLRKRLLTYRPSCRLAVPLAAPIIHFDDVEIDLGKFEVRRQGRRIRLEKQPFDLLVLLLRNPGDLVARKDIAESLWGPDVFVETDRSINNAIRKIRLALRDDPERPRFIETVAGRGYRFIATVSFSTGSQPRSIAEHIVLGDEHGTLATNDSAVPTTTANNPVTAVETKRLPAVRAVKPLVLVLVAFFIVVGVIWQLRQKSDQRKERNAWGKVGYTQITNFTDSAVSPALSPDGRMVAFYRSDSGFLTPDQIWVKWLPGGEAVQVTNDPKLKYGVAFSPDGSRIAYTTFISETAEWKTFTISPLGGAPTLLLSNAAGLTWLDQHRILFSEVETGVHMGIVTATENRSDYRKFYFPQHERMMAHYSYASPDRQSALVVEMDPIWQRCRLISLQSSSESRQVGPQGPCTSAAWSLDGRWMYFGAEVDGAHHLWRERFPEGQLEQITYGPTEEDGVAMAPDGHSLITSIGLRESAIWIHDKQGDRALSSEGYVLPSSAKFSSDGKVLSYLMRYDSPASSSGLWRRDLESGKTEAILPGMSMLAYDVSNDGKEVVFSTQPPGKASQLWLAPLDGSSPPKQLSATGEGAPHFGPDGEIFFQFSDEKANYIGRISKDGSGRSKLLPDPVLAILGISPDRRLLITDSSAAILATSIRGGPPRRICMGWCSASWAPDGKFFYIGLPPNSGLPRAKTLAIPVPAGETLPGLPSSGIRGPEDAKAIPGTRLLDGWFIAPGPGPSTFAYVKTTMHRNLYRIPVP
jgi:DNA-binding winged helix-turn-helix (wHTH) protein/Tol biopolymer transport system component